MKTNILTKLRQSGFLKGQQVNAQKIASTKISKIIDVSHEIAELTLFDELRADNNLFVNSASSSLGGGRYPCSSLDCRVERARELAQFSALYSDRVYIRNFFADYTHDEKSFDDDAGIRSSFHNDILVMTLLEPLIKVGRIIPFSTPKFCPNCFAKESFGANADERLDNEFKRLKKKYLSQLSVKATYSSDYALEVEAPEELIDHGACFLHSSTPPVQLKQEIISKIHSGSTVKLSRADIKKLELAEFFAAYIFADITLELFTSQIFHTSFVTDRALHIDIVNAISGDSSLYKRNVLAEKYLTCLVPFLPSVEISDLIKLRQREEESFILFRTSLNKALDEYVKSGKMFTEATAKEIYCDVLAPQLAKLDLKIGVAKKDLIKSTRRKVIGWAGAISFGIYAGFIPSELATAASALGLTKVLADFIEMTTTKSDITDSIKSDEMYFLWQVRQVKK
jgi:hypothetical protein